MVTERVGCKDFPKPRDAYGKNSSHGRRVYMKLNSHRIDYYKSLDEER